MNNTDTNDSDTLLLKENNNIAYCGLYCPMCSFKTAAETEDRKHLSDMPERYDKFKERSFEDCACPGCKEQIDNCACKLGIKPCAEEKNINSCADCADFPCQKIDAFGHDGTPHHEDGLRNLLRIKEVGYEKWLEEMKEVMYCECAARQSWYYSCPVHIGR